MADNHMKLALAGTPGTASANPDTDAEHIATPTKCMVLPPLGATAEDVLGFVAQTPMTITGVRWVASTVITAGANNPDFGAAKGDLAAGALTVVSTPLDGTSQSYAARTAVSGVLSAVAGATSLDAGDGFYITVDTNGTPADVDYMTCLVDYELDG